MRRIVDFAIDGRPTWDLCCGHGLIGLWAWHVRDLPELHFVDRAPDLVRDLEYRIGAHVELDGMSFHRCDASKVQVADVPSNLILTGVGFRAFERIISRFDASGAAHRIIASVHAEVELLAPAMRKRGWILAGEVTLEENARTRTITAWDGQSG